MTQAAHDLGVVQAFVPERTGVLVIRVWVEREQPPELRARITRTLDVTVREDEVSTVATTTHEIEQTVRAWLASFVSSIGGGS